MGHYYRYSLSLQDHIGFFASKDEEDIITVYSCEQDYEGLTVSISKDPIFLDEVWIQNPQRIFMLSSDLFLTFLYQWPTNFLCAAEEMPVDDNDPFVLLSSALRVTVKHALTNNFSSAQIYVEGDNPISVFSQLPGTFSEVMTEISQEQPYFHHSIGGEIPFARLQEALGRTSYKVGNEWRKINSPLTFYFDSDSCILDVYFEFIVVIILE